MFRTLRPVLARLARLQVWSPAVEWSRQLLAEPVSDWLGWSCVATWVTEHCGVPRAAVAGMTVAELEALLWEAAGQGRRSAPTAAQARTRARNEWIIAEARGGRSVREIRCELEEIAVARCWKPVGDEQIRKVIERSEDRDQP